MWRRLQPGVALEKPPAEAGATPMDPQAVISSRHDPPSPSARQRQADGERRALTFAGARRGDRAAVRFHELLDDPQAEAETAMRPLGLALPECFEQVRQKRRIDTFTVVLHDELAAVSA